MPRPTARQPGVSTIGEGGGGRRPPSSVGTRMILGFLPPSPCAFRRIQTPAFPLLAPGWTRTGSRPRWVAPRDELGPARAPASRPAGSNDPSLCPYVVLVTGPVAVGGEQDKKSSRAAGGRTGGAASVTRRRGAYGAWAMPRAARALVERLRIEGRRSDYWAAPCLV
jgi:hypothetical protein